MKTIYLDYAAATPVDSRVVEVMRPFFADDFYNPSAIYLAGRAVRKELDAARAGIARNLGARPAEVIFTAGATEANNLAIRGVMDQFPDGEVLVSAIEHDSVLAPARQFRHREIPVTPRGIIDLAKLEKMITDKTVLVSVMLVNNELGTIQPLREVKKILNMLSISRRSKNHKLPLYLHTDAAQAPLYLDLHVARLGVDLLSVNGGKIHGPKQSGALYVKAGTKLAPQILGGGQEFGLRSGTENVAGSVGLAKAMEIAGQERAAAVKHVVALRDLFIELLSKEIPAAAINGSPRRQVPHILSVTFPSEDNERLMMRLDEAAVQAAVGSACGASSAEPSHVLGAIGLSDEEARATLRFSLGKKTTERDIKYAVEKLVEFVRSQQ